MTVKKRVVRLDADALAALEEQRAFLRRSLDDLHREHEAGDLDDDDFTTLHHDYEERLTTVERAVDEGKAEFVAARAARRPARTALITAAVLVFAVVCGVIVARTAGRRDATGTITGDIAKTARDRNAGCLALVQSKPSAAVDCYTAVLKDAPGNVEALAYRGWIRFKSGDGQGVTDLRNAVMIDGTYPDVHAFLADVLLSAGCITDAANELTRLGSLNPSPLVSQIAESIKADVQTALTASTTTTTTCGAK